MAMSVISFVAVTLTVPVTGTEGIAISVKRDSGTFIATNLACLQIAESAIGGRALA